MKIECEHNNNKLYQYSDGQTKNYEFKPYETDIWENKEKEKLVHTQVANLLILLRLSEKTEMGRVPKIDWC